MSCFCIEEYKPCLAMIVTQCIYAIMTLLAKASFSQGFSPFVFVVYRQGIATLVLVPYVILAKRGRINELALGLSGFSLVFLASLAGATVNQALYYEGLQLGSSSMAAAMINLVPALSFVLASSVGLEQVNLKSLRSWAKIIGTIICVGGAITMALHKGPSVLNMSYQNFIITILHKTTDTWLLGGLCLMGATSCWSFWLILQVPICKSYTDPLTLSAWMCFLSTFLSAVLTFFLVPNLSDWKITSLCDLSACLFAGVFTSGVTFYLQAWCISVRGPLYSAVFTPLCTVITTVLAFIILHEELHIGSLIGGMAIIGGLYVVLWGKAEDIKSKGKEASSNDDQPNIAISIDTQSVHSENTAIQPLLALKP